MPSKVIFEIVDFQERLHLYAVRECLVELQDFERKIDPRMPTGVQIDKAYVAEMRKRCKTSDGKILVAQVGADVVGYATVLSKVQSDEIDAGDLEYALISDLVVKEAYRGNGIGSRLMREAEAFAIANGAKWLRIGVLAANQLVRKLYESNGFSEVYVELEKSLTDSHKRRKP